MNDGLHCASEYLMDENMLKRSNRHLIASKDSWSCFVIFKMIFLSSVAVTFAAHRISSKMNASTAQFQNEQCILFVCNFFFFNLSVKTVHKDKVVWQVFFYLLLR